MDWPLILQRLQANEPCVLVTLRQHKGSAPRESGARMIVTGDKIEGSIGGGNLEYQAIATAREMLESPRHPGKAEGLVRDPPAGTESPTEPVGPGQRYSRFRDDVSSLRESGMTGSPRLEPYGLGPALNQCCGGSVELMFEVLTPPAPDWLLALAAAGARGDPAVLATAIDATDPRHIVALPVGRESALPEGLRDEVRRLLDDPASGPISVVAADGCDWWLQRVAKTRRSLMLFGAGHVGKAVVKALADLPFELRWIDARADAFPEGLPDNVTTVRSDDPVAEVPVAIPGTSFIVMTHSHDLDEDICHAVLSRDDFAFLGLIGSVSKRRRFVHRLEKRGIDSALLERLICPIGLPDIRGKEPATIALSLAAQLMSEPREG